MTRAQIMLLGGSLRSGSTNEAVLRTAQAVAPEGVRADLYGGLAALPHFNPDDDYPRCTRPSCCCARGSRSPEAC